MTAERTHTDGTVVYVCLMAMLGEGTMLKTCYANYILIKGNTGDEDKNEGLRRRRMT